MSKQILRHKIQSKEAKIAVVGIGYIGLTTTAVFANMGFHVTGIDVNPTLVKTVSQGNSPIKEPGLAKLIAETSRRGTLTATANSLQTLGEADIVIVCVQTPLNKKGTPQLTYLKKACTAIAKALTPGKLIVIQSTLPPQAVKNVIVPLLESESGLVCGVDFWLTYCPERMTPGRGIRDLETNARVLGGYTVEGAELGAELFRFITNGGLHLTDVATAEVVKLSENAFRYVNIAYANELAFICTELGVDVEDVVRLANTHPRVNIHTPGCGVGGPCLAKDTGLLVHSMRTTKFTPRILLESRNLNEYMPRYTVELVVAALGAVGKRVEDSKIAILGTAYKGGVDDARNSPAEAIIQGLLTNRAHVVFYDPYCAEGFGAERATDLLDAVTDADGIVITTAHDAFRNLDLTRVAGLMKENPIMVDGRRIITPREAERNGIVYFGIGYGDPAT